MKAIQSVIYALTGVNIFANASAKAYSSMASSASDASKSSKEASNSIADFDEIHNIQKDNGSNSGSGTGATSPSFDLSNVESLDSSILDAIKNGNWYEIGENIGNKLSETLEKIPWEEIQDKARNIATNIADLINGFVDGTKWEVVGSTIGNGVNTALTFVDTYLKKTNFEKIGKSISTTLNSEIKTQDWNLTGQTIADGINSAIDTAYGFVKDFEWGEAGIAIGTAIDTAIQNIEWDKLGTTLWEGIKGILTFVKNMFFTAVKTTAVNSVTEVLTSQFGLTTKEVEELKPKFEEAYTKLFIEGDWSVLTESVKTIGHHIVEGLKQGIHDKLRDMKDWILEKFNESIIGTIINLFQIHSPSKVMYDIGQYIIQGLINGISNPINKIITIFTTLKEKVVLKFQELKDKVITKVTNTIEETKNKFNTMKDKVFTTVGDLKDSVTTKFTLLADNAKTWGKDLVDNMANGIKKNVKKITDAASSVADKIKGFLGFSEPDVGPLSNFHTYMPDMIDLMVEGIRSNMKKVTDELETLTKNMSYTINTDSISNIPTIQYNTSSLQTQSTQENVLYENIKKALANNSNTRNNETINFENKLVVNGKVFAREIIEDLNSEAIRRGYKPLLQH